MSRRFLLGLLLLVATVAVFWLGKPKPEPAAPRPAESPALPPPAAMPSPAATPSPAPAPLPSAAPSAAPPAPATSSTTPPVPPPQPAAAQSPAAPAVAAAVAADLDEVSLMFRDYRAAVGENPVGSNAEIMRAIAGGNPKQVKLPVPEGSSLNGEGELIDRWGTPYFFHQLSGTRMEIRSAGPDRQLGTEDDRGIGQPKEAP